MINNIFFIHSPRNRFVRIARNQFDIKVRYSWRMYCDLLTVLCITPPHHFCRVLIYFCRHNITKDTTKTTRETKNRGRNETNKKHKKCHTNPHWLSTGLFALYTPTIALYITSKVLLFLPFRKKGDTHQQFCPSPTLGLGGAITAPLTDARCAWKHPQHSSSMSASRNRDA